MYSPNTIVNKVFDEHPPTLVPADEQPPAMVGWSWRGPLMLGATALLIAVLFLVPRDVVEQLGAYGYLGVFLFMLLSSATVVLPSPALGMVLWAGQTLNPWLVGLIERRRGWPRRDHRLSSRAGRQRAGRAFALLSARQGWVQRWGC